MNPRFSNRSGAVGGVLKVVWAHGLQTATSVLMVLVLPWFLGQTGYGYLQLYLLYSSFIGFFHLGFCDGLLLRLGGKRYAKLRSSVLAGEFYMLVAFHLLVALLLIAIAAFAEVPPENRAVVFAFALTVVISGTRAMPLVLLQATARFESYSRVIVFDRSLYISLLALAGVCGLLSDFKVVICISVVSCFGSAVVAVWSVRHALLDRSGLRPRAFVLRDVARNVAAGFPLMLANIAGMLVIAVVRQAVVVAHGVEAFGQLSLGISVANFAMVFVGAVGTVVFPFVRRTERPTWASGYVRLRSALSPILLTTLCAYTPLAWALSRWLPDFSEATYYLIFLLPMLVFEARQGLIVVPFMKAARQERTLLCVNLAALVLSAMLSVYLVATPLPVVWGAVFILVAIAARGLLCEWALLRVLEATDRALASAAAELSAVVAFIIFNLTMPPLLALATYCIAVGIYLLVFRVSIQDGIRLLRTEFRRDSTQ